ncbi:O-fucosyltransferase family protein [Heracleum sosnowskyi]|uniref:O-fucosyltransferase family protein n=1 Tax=Heracleum sosnowskyi TaxID=360622 RepID=A0AAD8IM90_9APIA|nr:O-fucosyltransferase family protein [Heracleum sosnowskyi]
MAILDIRQLVAGILTFSMFIMLGNMIKKDHFDPAFMDQVTYNTGDGSAVLSGQSLHKAPNPMEPWKNSVETVKPCWNKSTRGSGNQPKGYIIFSLTGGAHLHLSQVANAVLVAKQVKATLVLPGISGNKAGEKRDFGDVYDVHNFISKLNGTVNIAYRQPPELFGRKLPIARIPSLISEAYVTANLEPLFKRKGNLKIETYFSTPNMTKVEGMKYMNSVSCIVMFEALQLQAGLQELIDSVLEKLKTLNQESHGRFIAVDWRAEMLGTKRCQGTTTNGKKSCFIAPEVGQFLNMIGFEKNTTIYLTQDGWHRSLDALTNTFPNTYTKESLIPLDKVAKFSDFTDVIDFYVCSRSDVFVPAFSRLFYASVVGQRIALGKTQIYDPAQATSSDVDDYISFYISRKNHWAYSCFC